MEIRINTKGKNLTLFGKFINWILKGPVVNLLYEYSFNFKIRIDDKENLKKDKIKIVPIIRYEKTNNAGIPPEYNLIIMLKKL